MYPMVETVDFEGSRFNRKAKLKGRSGQRRRREAGEMLRVQRKWLSHAPDFFVGRILEIWAASSRSSEALAPECATSWHPGRLTWMHLRHDQGSCRVSD
eukprot:scaffold2224_cov261-Pinguiococcus_pyrenoidosus.AAC.16